MSLCSTATITTLDGSARRVQAVTLGQTNSDCMPKTSARWKHLTASPSNHPQPFLFFLGVSPVFTTILCGVRTIRGRRRLSSTVARQRVSPAHALLLLQKAGLIEGNSH